MYIQIYLIIADNESGQDQFGHWKHLLFLWTRAIKAGQFVFSFL